MPADSGLAPPVTGSPTARERQLAAVERLAQVGFWEWEVASDRLTWTDATYRLFGHEPGAFVPDYGRWVAAIHPDDREMAESVVARAIETGESYGFDHRVVQPDGTVRVPHCRGDLERDGAGRPVRLVGIVSDVTERRRTDDRLCDLLADAAHELRTPLAAIQSGLDVLSQPSLPQGVTDAATAAVARQLDKLRRLADGLLELGALRPEAGPILTSPVRVAVAVGRVVAAMDDEVRGRVRLDIDPDVTVRAASGLLERLLTALLDNALVHGGPHVVVEVRARGSDAIVAVEDDGPGVPADLVDHLFTPFSRGRDTQGGGAGLGLVLVRRLADALCGVVTYRSVDPHGARFVVTLESVDAHPAG